jgi:hypothetical protein
MEVTREMLAAKFELIFRHLDERQRRLLMGRGLGAWAWQDPAGGAGDRSP